MFGSISTSRVYVVRCKRCQRDVPAGLPAFPPGSVTVLCSLCGELRRYRSTEVYLGAVNQIVRRQQAAKRR